MPDRKSIAVALLLAMAILLGTWFSAEKLKQSAIYTQGRLFGNIMTQNSAELLPMLQSREKREAAVKFIEAVTTAYLDFELIPYNESDTLSLILGSLDTEIHIKSFEYRRRDLIIIGLADTPEDYWRFIERLSKTERFSDISGEYAGKGEGVAFTIECVA